MEQAIESLMLKLDNEKRESDYLDDQIKTLESSFASLKASKRYDSPKKNPLLVKISLLEKQIEYEIAQFDQLKNENFEIRKEVDRFRLENKAYKNSLANLKALIQTSSFRVIKLKELKNAKVVSMQSYQEKISAIRSKSVLHKAECDEKIRNLSSVIRQRSQILVDEKNNDRLNELLNNLKGCNVFGIQGVLIKKWDHTVKSKQEEIEMYQKHIDRINTGFLEIKAAFGQDKVNEIVTTFIKSEQQSHELYKYLSTLNGDIDSVHETLNTNKASIEKILMNKGSDKKYIDRLATLRSRLNSTQKKIEESEEANKQIAQYLDKSIESLKQLSRKLKNFNPELSEFIDSDEFSLSDFPRILKELDKVIENISTSIVPYRVSGSHSVSMPQYVSQIIEQKELYDDPELQESKYPIPASVFIEKASKLVNNI